MKKPIFANPEIEKEYRWLKSKDKKRLVQIYGDYVKDYEVKNEFS